MFWQILCQSRERHTNVYKECDICSWVWFDNGIQIDHFYIQWSPRLPVGYEAFYLLQYSHVITAALTSCTSCTSTNLLVCIALLPCPHELFFLSSTGKSVCTVSVCVKSMLCAPCPDSWRRWWWSWCPTSRGTPSQTTTRDAPRRNTPGCRLVSSLNRSADATEQIFMLLDTNHVPEKACLLFPESNLNRSFYSRPVSV